MYTIRGGWAVQTFALAKCNESEGRKYRIRRSKEERKAMVESYIKKYQSSNNGNFPSLNLTHKEVGGSFYTVREIVREVIQENRVLGPAKLTPEEVKAWNANQLLDQHPLGSISYEPQIPLTSSPNRTHFEPDHQSTSGEVIITTNGQIINESQMEIKGEEADDVKCLELQASDPSEAKKVFEEEMVASTAKMNLPEIESSEAKENLEERTVWPIASVDLPQIGASEAKENLEEKTVPPIAKVDLPEIEPSEVKENVEEDMFASQAALHPLVTEVKDNSEEKLHAPKIEVNPLPVELIAETFPLRLANKSSGSLDARLGDVSISTSSFEKTEAEEVKLGSPDTSSISLLYKSVLVDKDEEKEVGVHNSQSDTNVETYEPHNNEALAFYNEANDQSQTGAEVKAVNVLNGASTKYSKGASNKAEVKLSGSSKKGNNPTVDRVNLESWEGPSKTSPQQDKNPLLAIFKLFISSFMKFWSE